MSPAEAEPRCGCRSAPRPASDQLIGRHIVVSGGDDLDERRHRADGGAKTRKDWSSSRNPNRRRVANTDDVGNPRRHKGLWLSVLLRPNIAVGESARMTDLLAHADRPTLSKRQSASAVRSNHRTTSTSRPESRWRARRNASGSKMAATAPSPGSGINVNQAPEDFPPELRETAGSLAMVAGQRVDRNTLR